VNAIEAVGLTKRFGDKVALDGVSFSAREGEVLGLLGPNGAGKTTTVRILTGVLKPDSGSATIMGLDVVKEALEARRLVGYLPEAPCLYERLTVWDNLAFYGRLYDVPEHELRRRIKELLAELGLEGRANEKAGALSKGLKQRVAIARALLHDPPVLLLDQPTSDLDPASAREVRDLVRELNRAGKTILICTHNLAEAEELCHRVAIINEGHVLAIGPPDELLKDVMMGYRVFKIRSLKPIGRYLSFLSDLEGVISVERVGEREARIKLEREEAISRVIRELTLFGCDLLEVRMLRPSLEEIYLKLVRREGVEAQ